VPKRSVPEENIAFDRSLDEVLKDYKTTTELEINKNQEVKLDKTGGTIMTKKRQSRATKVVLASLLAASLSVPSFASAASISTSNNAAVTIADALTQTVDFHVYKTGTTEPQPAISSHIVPTGRIVEKDGNSVAELTIAAKSAAMIAGLQIKQGEDFVDATGVENADGTITYSFPVVADQIHSGKIHVVVPTANMDKWYDFDFKATVAKADVEVEEEVAVKVYKDGTTEESVMKNYVSPKVNIAKTGSKNVVTMTFPKGHYIQAFKVEGKAAVLVSDDKVTNERKYAFEVADLTKLVNSEIHVIVNEGPINYDENHKVQFGFDVKDAQTPIVNPFKDIDNDGNKDAILALLDKNIIKSQDKFNPRNNITRSQFALMVARALELKPTQSAGFKDIADIKDQERVNAINALAAAGIVQKVEKFNPNNTLTRQQGALMLYRAVKYVAGQEVNMGDTSLSYYADGAVVTDPESQRAFALLYAGGIMTGSKTDDGKTLIKANNPLQRTQMAKILNGSLGYMVQK